MPFAVLSEYRGECSTLVLVREDDIPLLVEPEQVLMCEAHRVGGSFQGIDQGVSL